MVDNFALPRPPQKGSSQLIDAGDRRVLSAVWDGFRLWVTATRLDEYGRTGAFWVSMSADADSALNPIVGFVDGDAISPGAWTYFPSLDLGPSGNVALGFSASGQDLYPGAYMVLIDPKGMALGSPQTVKSGSLPFTAQFLIFPDRGNPYGAYSSTALDPELSNCYWTFNQFPLDKSSCRLADELYSGCWGTAWGRFCVPRSTFPECEGDGSCGETCGDCDTEEYSRLGCSCKSCECRVCDKSSWCCEVSWDGYCTDLAKEYCRCGQDEPTPAPSVSEFPSISLEPSVSSEPSVSEFPSISLEPSVSSGPSASEFPSISLEPSVSSGPSVSKFPSITLEPSGSSSPESFVTPTRAPRSPPKTPAPSLRPTTATPTVSPSTSPSSSPTTPFTLVSPHEGENVNDPLVTFEWTLVWNPADINRVVYQIEYKDEITRVWTRLFRDSVPVAADGDYEETQNLVELGGPSAFAEYKWRILVDAKPRTGFPSIKTDWVLFNLV